MSDTKRENLYAAARTFAAFELIHDRHVRGTGDSDKLENAAFEFARDSLPGQATRLAELMRALDVPGAHMHTWESAINCVQARSNERKRQQALVSEIQADANKVLEEKREIGQRYEELRTRHERTQNELDQLKSCVQANKYGWANAMFEATCNALDFDPEDHTWPTVHARCKQLLEIQRDRDRLHKSLAEANTTIAKLRATL